MHLFNKKNMEKVYRNFAEAPTVTGRTISGYAIVFNSRSHPMRDKIGTFIEIMLPSAVTEQTILDSNIKMVLEHNPDRLLARSNKGKGTLGYSIDEHGVRYEFEAPHTADGDFAVEMVKRGDISGASFAFTFNENDTERKNNGKIDFKYIKKIHRLYDFSLVADPAYPSTDANVRRLQSSKGCSAKAKRLKKENDQKILEIYKKDCDRAISKQLALGRYVRK